MTSRYLQATTGGFILTPDDLYKWCVQHITGIHFIWVHQDEVNQHGKELEERFDRASRTPGTRDKPFIYTWYKWPKCQSGIWN